MEDLETPGGEVGTDSLSTGVRWRSEGSPSEAGICHQGYR